MSAHVYRCYDRDGILLYVGCTSNLKKRMNLHARDGRARASHALQVLMHSYDAETFPTLAEAQAAELAAIRAERPLLNMQGTRLPGYVHDNALAAYLMERGLPLDVGGLHRCTRCDMLRGWHMPRGLCTFCREEPVMELPVGMTERATA